MNNINNQLNESLNRVEQLKNQKKSKERREKDKKRKADARRHFANGRLVDKYLEAVEPVIFENILRLLVANDELLSRLKNEADKLK